MLMNLIRKYMKRDLRHLRTMLRLIWRHESSELKAAETFYRYMSEFALAELCRIKKSK